MYNRIMRTLTTMALVVLSATVARGQSARYDNIALGARGPIAGATIAVCTQPASTGTTPCSPLATLATSTNTTSGGANPLTADALGNFHFYAAPGTYTIQIYGPQVASPYVMTDVNVVATLTITASYSGVSVPSANTTSAQTMVSVSYPSAQLNILNRAYRVKETGLYVNNSGGSETVSFYLTPLSNPVASVTAATAGAANIPFAIDAICFVTTAGSSGALTCSGTATIGINVGTTISTPFNQTSLSVDLTGVVTLGASISFSTASVSNGWTQGALLIEQVK